MFCTNCGNELNDKAAVCTKCGLAVGLEKKFCAACGTEIKDSRQVICLNCGIPLAASVKGKISDGAPHPPRSRTAYILFGVFLGAYGVHNFYAGYTSKAVKQLIVGIVGFVLSFFVIGIPVLAFAWGWAIYDIINTTTDADGNEFV